MGGMNKATTEIELAPVRPDDHWSEYARQTLGLHDHWQWYSIERDPDGVAMPKDVTKLTGCVPTIKTRGPDKGEPNWRRPLPGTHRVVWIERDKFDAWLLEWERKTGKCHRCYGKGQVIRRWSKDEGTEYRDCDRCGGTGKAVGDER